MRSVAQSGLLVALALVLSLVERWFPLQAVIPIPGVRLGLANLVLIFALVRLDFQQTLLILICRIILASIFIGSFTSFWFSLLGGLCATGVMWLLLHGWNRWFSLPGVSIAGAAAHHVGQILAAMLVLKSHYVLAYLPILLMCSLPLGFLTGYTTQVVFQHLYQIEQKLPKL